MYLNTLKIGALSLALLSLISFSGCQSDSSSDSSTGSSHTSGSQSDASKADFVYIYYNYPKDSCDILATNLTNGSTTTNMGSYIGSDSLTCNSFSQTSCVTVNYADTVGPNSLENTATCVVYWSTTTTQSDNSGNNSGNNSDNTSGNSSSSSTNVTNSSTIIYNGMAEKDCVGKWYNSTQSCPSGSTNTCMVVQVSTNESSCVVTK